MSSKLVPEYHKARTVVIVSASTIILKHLGISFKGSIPILQLDILDDAKIPYILGCVLCYGLVRLLIEWYQSDSEHRRRLPSRIDLSITLIFFFTAAWFIAKDLMPPINLENVSILASLAIISVGVATGEFLDISIFNLLLIRSKAEARKLALPRIPVAVRASWRIGYIVVPAFALVVLLSPIFNKPMSQLWLWLLCLPIILMLISGMLSLVFQRHRNKEGKKISRQELIKELRKAFDIHDAMYQVGGWDAPIPASNSTLYNAAERGDKETVVKTLNDGDNPNELNMHGWTALMIAVAQQHEDIAEILLEKGANPNISNIQGRSALMFAARYGNKNLVQSLLRYGADPNLNESHDPGPLSAAAFGGHNEIVELLLKEGADPTSKDRDGKGPIDYAEAGGQGNISALLRKEILSLKGKQ